jgi:hypothetical protein
LQHEEMTWVLLLLQLHKPELMQNLCCIHINKQGGDELAKNPPWGTVTSFPSMVSVMSAERLLDEEKVLRPEINYN